MQALGTRSISAYLTLLKQDNRVLEECQIHLTVSISRFFRDRRLWQTLELDILPEMVVQHPQSVHVWSAGCARGEEVYTFRIVWDRVCAGLDPAPSLKLLGSDMARERIADAQTGVYAPSSLKDVPQEILNRYFEKIEGKTLYAVKAFLKTGIQWRFQNHLSAPPKQSFHIIFLRNSLLTYTRKHLQSQPFRRIRHCLVPGGWLIVGAHEKPPADMPGLRRHRTAPWAYQNIA